MNGASERVSAPIGTACIIVEQDINRATAVADRVICMLEGRIVLEGRSAELSRQQITEAYFGLSEAQTKDRMS
jgi:branched-chain amino acid transport system ATP-binding protein